jgi:hypothetical protein
MRITVSHNKTQQEAMASIDQAVDDLFQQMPIAGLQILDRQKQWNGNVMHFLVTGKMGFFSAPVRGTVLVTDRDVTLDIELPGIVNKFIPEEKIRAQVESRVKGLLT